MNVHMIAIAGLLVAAGTVHASNIATIEAQPSGTSGLTAGSGGDPTAVVTAILSQPGTFNGKTYTSWSFLVNDGSGSLDVFGAMPGGYTPTVGDAVTATGTFSPFHQIPELATITSITANTSGNTVPAVQTATIPQLNVATQPLSNVGYLWEVDNVTVSGEGTGNWGITNSPSGATISDGSNSITLFYWPTSYAAANVNLANTPIPTGPVNMIGFVSDFNNVAEFTPISIVAVPEPAALSVLGLGGLMLAARSGRRKLRGC